MHKRNALWVCEQLIFRAIYCATVWDVQLLYDIANEVCDREQLGDEIVDDVYEALAKARDAFE